MGLLRPRTRSSLVSAWIGISLGLALVGATLARGAPQDPFALALPGRATQPAQGEPSAAGEGSVSEQHGSASYSFPIAVPPGRRGMAPALALSYGSGSPLRGGIAVGWSLDLPSIERDPDAPSLTRYTLSMPGVSGTLVEVTGDVGTGTRYRVEIDDQFARVSRSGSTWTVLTPDGVVRTFAGTGSDGSTRWQITSEKDPWGNEIVYTWGFYTLSGYSDLVLQRIEYTSNAAASLSAHAKVEFSWASPEYCSGQTVPKGAQTDLHFGVKRMRGMQRLTQIKTHARDTQGGAWRLVQQHSLSYDADALSCSNGPPLRLLTQIDTTAWNAAGASVAAPPVRFGYGAMLPDYGAGLPRTGGLGYGTEKGPESARMDIDGDGVADVVSVRMPDSGSTRCLLAWRKVAYGGVVSATEQVMELPTANWRSGGLPTTQDSCTLNGQFATRGSVTYGTGDGGHCTEPRGVQVAYHFMDWDSDGDVDLLTSNWATANATACGDFTDGVCTTEQAQQQGGEMPCADDPTGLIHCYCPAGQYFDARFGDCHEECPSDQEWNGAFCIPSCDSYAECTGGGGGGGEPPPPPPPPPGSGCTPSVQPQPESSGTPIWRVFLNDPTRPNGLRIDRTAWTRFQAPLPLPLNGGPLAAPQEGQPALPGLADVDGDGWQDLLDPNNSDVGDANTILVYRGQPGGTFSFTPVPWSKPTWDQHPDDWLFSGPGYPLYSLDAISFTDVNGDGLDDILTWAAEQSTYSLYVSYNQGGSFGSLTPLGVAGPVHQSRTEMAAPWLARQPLTTGWRADEHRFVDIDADGLPELVVLEATGSVQSPATFRRIYRFHGDRLTSNVPAGAELEPIEGLLRAIDRKAWFRASDFTDITGDGVPDLATSTQAGALTVQTRAATTPMRLLTSVDNGRGAVTTFEYGRSAEPSLVTLVPGDTGTGRWLVRRMTVTPGGGQPAMSTRYEYAHPIRGARSPSDLGPAQFLGFETVTSYRSGQQGPESARTTRTFDYEVGPDRSGRLSLETSAMSMGGTWVPVSQEETIWENQALLGGAVSFTYVRSTTSRSIGDMTAPDAIKSTQHTYTPWTSAATGQVLFYEPTETLEWDGLTSLTLRATVHDYQERVGQSPYAATDYRILPISEEQQVVFVGIRTPLSRTETDYDTRGAPITTRVSTGSFIARSVRTFDPNTGLLQTEKRPNQVAVNGTKVMTVSYDAHKVFVATTWNELGHTVGETRDVGTGALTRTSGPNYRVLSAPGCVPSRTTTCSKLTYYEKEEWSIDGFGRVTEHRVATDAPTGHYALTPAERFTYVDLSTPNRVVSQSLRDFGGSVWVTSEVSTDGLGRTLTSIERHQQAGRPDATTSHTYDAGGALRSVSVPDPQPRGDSAAQITYTYDRDGLGRVTGLQHPGGEYDQTVYVAANQIQRRKAPVEGFGAVTELRHDGLGRLLQVHEHDNPREGVVAVTTYGYDMLDRVTSIVDADGVSTTMGHDMRGLRTSVTRGSRTWSYVYDSDGNMTQVRTPVEAGGTVAQYTSTSTFDELDRVTSQTPATRGMSAARMAQLGIGTVTTSYDGAENGIGQVASVTQSGVFQFQYQYDVRGQIKREQRSVTLSAAQGATLSSTQWTERTYNALGQPLEVVWDDGTRWRHGYDNRGQPTSVDWLDPSTSTYKNLASYERGVDGLPRVRKSAWDQRREWRYDVAGRVIFDRVYAPFGGQNWIERNYGFDGFGHLAVTDGTVTQVPVEATYIYDRRGRIELVNATNGYDASFSYSAGGNLLTARIQGSIDNSDRDVQYLYNAADPQAVGQLRDRATGAPVATMSYDLAGNVRSRAAAGGTSQLAWGGDDQLREVNGPGGLERYVYAGTSQRIAAIGPDGVRLWFGDSETKFSLAGVQQKRWHHVALGEPIARLEVATAPSVELQYADALQNLSLTVSTTGVVTSSFVYGAFGEVLAAIGAETHRRQFNGKEVDAATGLRFYGYRYYDPLLLRWTAGDPLFRFSPDAAWAEPQRANLYAFSLNNPLTYYDPDGRDSNNTECTGDEECRAWRDRPQHPDADLFLPVLERLYDEAPSAETLFFVGVNGAAAFYPPAAPFAFFFDMSQARNHDETVPAMLGYGLSKMFSSADDVAAASDDVAKAGPTGQFYSVAYEMKLDPLDLGRSRSVHFNRANATLFDDITLDPDFGAKLDAISPGVAKRVAAKGGRKNPRGFVWHHADTPGVLQLVPKYQHTCWSIFWKAMHEGGRGGYSRWAIPAGAPKN